MNPDIATPVPTRELREADILLCHGSSLLDHAIRSIDGSDFNHAAIVLDPGALTTGNATESGLKIKKLSLADLRAHENWVAGYRRRLNAPTPGDTTLAPIELRSVVEAAEAMLHRQSRFAYEKLFLLAFLCIARRIVPDGPTNRLVRLVLDRAAKVLADLVEAAAGDRVEPMICSEFVIRSYRVGLPDHAADIPFTGPGLSVHLGSLLDHALSLPPTTTYGNLGWEEAALGSEPGFERELGRRLTASIDRRLPPDASHDAAWGEETVLHLVRLADRLAAVPAARDTPLERLSKAIEDFITPGDLARSDKLAVLGRLE